MKRRSKFTKESPPTCGYVKKIWDWWIEKTGNPPCWIEVNHPGINQLRAGMTTYYLMPSCGASAGWNVYQIDKGDIESAETPSDLYYGP